MMRTIDQQYIALTKAIVERGQRRPTRAKLASTGEHIDALTLFGHDGNNAGLSIVAPDIWYSFPLLTTKRVWFHGVTHELLWMLSGSTNVRALHEAGVHIWDSWMDERGELGPVYGAQWRAWNGKVDQIENLIRDIRTVIDDPHASEGRRLILTGWNVEKIPEMKLPPCHTLAQWDVDRRERGHAMRLNCTMYMRSCDAFLGLPFNIAQYALLTTLLAHVASSEVLLPGSLTVHFGNLHVYTNHVDNLREQWERSERPSPCVVLTGHVDRTLRNVDPNVVALREYNPHGPLRGEVAI